MHESSVDLVLEFCDAQVFYLNGVCHCPLAADWDWW